ncbi:coiled-coil domain-containing protein 146 [Patella vulgata]|uniref:coiled-coil domain-containing protein 146 n=1 Tax=Patella vulgata TaxID=6465 RepID=UPI0024A94A57|nr:coiled-coil domain-containing protein 146 [Patella vulgata]
MSSGDEGEMDELAINPEEYEAPISAVAPLVVRAEENQVEVSASPAFQRLDELFQQGKLTGTKVAWLKSKYTELHDLLKVARTNESNLLQDAKEYNSVLEQNRIELEKGDNFPESENTEVTKLREQYLKYTNELAQTEERQYQMEYKIECLQEEKKLVEREYSRLPKQGEVEKKIKELQTACDDMRKEIAQRQNESKNLREDLDTANRQMVTEKKEYEKLNDEMEKLKGELVQIQTIPGSIMKESDKLTRQKNEVGKKGAEYEEEFNNLKEAKEMLENKRKELTNEKLEIDKELDRNQALFHNKEQELDSSNRECSLSKEREAVLMGDKASVEMNLRHIQLEKKNQHDIHARRLREKDRDLKNLKKAENQLKVSEETLNHTKMIYDKLKSQADTMPKDDGTNLKKKKELQKEVEQNKRALAQEKSLTAVEHVKLEASAQEEQNLLYEQSDLRIEVVELTRLAAIKADEREQKARDFMRAETRYHRAFEDLKTKQLQIQDHQKKYQEMQQKLKDFAKSYDVIKNERNKCVNLIQTSTQKAAEMKEKIKILQNEIEILRTSVMEKDRMLQKSKLKHMASIVERDSQRNEFAKQQRIHEDMRDTKDQQKMDIMKLNLMINQAEEQMVRLRKRYEVAVQNRNERGLKLIERDEEVCIFYEKVNIQDQMIRNGEVELKAREEEIRFLKMKITEEKRGVGLMSKTVPEKRTLGQELVNLQIELQKVQDHLLSLEKNLENPNNDKRVRYIDGNDPSPPEMQAKIEELELRLAEAEEQLLEKALIYDQTNRIVNRIKGKAESGKEDTLSLAKNVNLVQSRIKDTTRKMMALVSELSMNQANSMRLQQHLKENEVELEQCYIRMEKGEPPSDEIENEWVRFLRDQERRSLDKEERLMMEEEGEQYKIAGGLYTTADPRPNAYIPDDDADLPIPRPYGSHAPFKPVEPGSSMRHIRKPIPKPIEI